jgi:hypothetical protein
MDRYLEEARRAVLDAVGAMSDEQLSAAHNEKWSAAQIIEHLALAFGATANGLNRAAAAPKLDMRRPTIRDRFATIVVVKLQYIPTGRKAPEMTVPSGLPPQDALRKLDENLQAMDAAIRRAEERWGRQLIAPHPILGPLTADQWRKFHMVHAKHHAKQIVAIKAAAMSASKAAA